MAINSIDIPWNYSTIFNSFALVLIGLDLVAGYTPIEHHHNNHVCNHQHPKAHDVRHFEHLFTFALLSLSLSLSSGRARSYSF